MKAITWIGYVLAIILFLVFLGSVGASLGSNEGALWTVGIFFCFFFTMLFSAMLDCLGQIRDSLENMEDASHKTTRLRAEQSQQKDSDPESVGPTAEQIRDSLQKH